MTYNEKTLDLTVFNRGAFSGRIRIRTLFDWANDYWEKGYRLARVKLSSYEYHELMAEFREDNMYLQDKLHNGTISVNTPFGEMEIIEVTNKEFNKKYLGDAKHLVDTVKKIRHEKFLEELDKTSTPLPEGEVKE